MFKGIVTSAVITTLLAAPMASAQTNCAPRETVIERLQAKYAERLKGGGLQNANTLLEVWASEATGSFTILLTHANGMSCVVSSGHNWNTIVPAKESGESSS